MGPAGVGALRRARGGSVVLQLHAAPGMAGDRRVGRGGACVVARRRHPLGSGCIGGAPLRVDRRRGVAPRATRWGVRNGPPHRCHGHAGSLDPARLERWPPAWAPTEPALCINRSESRGSSSVPGAERASFTAGSPADRTRRGAYRTGGPLTTDRLVTPFHASRAQSGPRKVSPMNFTGGSRSIQRLLAARPLLTCWSRGRA